MIAASLGQGSEVARLHPSLSKAAEERKGTWLVTMYDYDRRGGWLCGTGWFIDLFCGVRVKETKVKFTDKEWTRVSHLARHGFANGGKETTIKANMEMAGQTFWATGSVEHVAMRTLGTVAVLRALSGSGGVRYPWWTLYWDVVYAKYRRVDWYDDNFWWDWSQISHWWSHRAPSGGSPAALADVPPTGPAEGDPNPDPGDAPPPPRLTGGTFKVKVAPRLTTSPPRMNRPR